MKAKKEALIQMCMHHVFHLQRDWLRDALSCSFGVVTASITVTFTVEDIVGTESSREIVSEISLGR